MFKEFIKMSCPLCGSPCSFLVSIDRAVLGEVSITFKKEIACCTVCGTEYKPVLEKKVLFKDKESNSSPKKNADFKGASILFPCPSGCCSGSVAVFVKAEKAYPTFHSLKEAEERKGEAELGMLTMDVLAGETGACDECEKFAQVSGEKMYFQIRKLLS